MSDIRMIFNCELNSLTYFQEKLHLLDLEDDRSKIQSEYSSYSHEKTAMNNLIIRSLKNTDGIYEVENESPFDLLENTVMTVMTPRISVRSKFESEYQVKFKDNLCHRLINSISLNFDDVIKQSFDYNRLTIYRNYLLLEDQKEYLESIGNIKELTSWSTILPSIDLNWYQPWYFNEDKKKSIPLFACRNTKIKFECNFCLDISKLLLMRKGNVEIPFDKKIINKVPNEYKFIRPKIDASYVRLSKEEKEDRLKDINSLTFNYNDFIKIKDNNIKLPDKDSVPLKLIYPCKALFIIPINKKTNEFLFEGKHIIKNVGILYQKDKKKLEEKTYNYIKYILSKHFPSKLYEEGLVGIPISNNIVSLNTDVGIAFSTEMDAELIVNYFNSNPYLENEEIIDSEEEEEETPIQPKISRNDKFKVEYLSLVSKEIIFEDGKCKKEELKSNSRRKINGDYEE